MTSTNAINIRYSDELEALISMAVVDGEISASERRLLLRRALEEGIDQDEFELVLKTRIYDIQRNAVRQGENLDTRGARMSMSTQKLFAQLSRVRTKSRRIEIINDFPLPSTQEDLLEFMVTMSAKVKAMHGDLSKEEQEEKRAYIAKYDEAVGKAQTFFPGDPNLQRVIHNTRLSAKQRKLRDGFWEKTMKDALPYIAYVVGALILLTICMALLGS